MRDRFQIALYYGTWGGLAAFGYFFLIWLTPYSPLGLARFGGFWIPVVFIMLAVYKKRKATAAEEGFSFGNAFLTGMTTVLVLGFLKALLVYLMIGFVDTGLLARTHAETISWLEWTRSLSPDPDEIDKQIELVKEAAAQSSNFTTAASEINLYFMGGIPVSLLAALIFKRKPLNG
jgi:hypothetical protein